MSILVRPDVGTDVGLGHLRRCLNVAGALRGEGVESAFLVPDGPGAELALAEGFAVVTAGAERGSSADVEETLEATSAGGASCLLVDSYALGEPELDRLVAAGTPVAAFDDRCLHPFPCRLVVNGGLGAETLPYTSSSGDTRFLLGAAYSPLRRAYWDGPVARPGPHDVPLVLVVFGGADLARQTPAAIAALDRVPGPLRIVAALGPLAGTLEEARSAARASVHEVEVVSDPPGFPALVAAADVAVSAGGGTLVELVAAGTPAVAVEVAANQRRGIGALAAAGAVELAGRAGEPGLETRIAGLVAELLADEARRARLADAGRGLLDGRGALRIAAALAALADAQ